MYSRSHLIIYLTKGGIYVYIDRDKFSGPERRNAQPQSPVMQVTQETFKSNKHRLLDGASHTPNTTCFISVPVHNADKR